jgi:hypothetical protein
MSRPHTNGSFAAMVASQDFSGAVKVLDEAIDETRQDYTAAQFRLVQLHLNRGMCNQRLHLNRKALKVRIQGQGSRRARNLLCTATAASPLNGVHMVLPCTDTCDHVLSCGLSWLACCHAGL